MTIWLNRLLALKIIKIHFKWIIFRIIDVRVVGVNFRLKNVQRMFNEPIVKKVHKIFQMDIKFLRKYSNAFRNFISGQNIKKC